MNTNGGSAYAIVINPKLTGGLQSVPGKQRVLKKTGVRFGLSDDELRRIHHCSREVVLDAIAEVRQRMGDRIERGSIERGNIDDKARDFLAVHNKGGQPCPRCGNPITELRANQRITSYCRRCQPGILLRN